MVKFYGVIFLGQPREAKLAHAHDADRLERLGLVWLALGCVVLGVLPVFVLMQLDQVTRLLTGNTVWCSSGAIGLAVRRWRCPPNARATARCCSCSAS